MQINRINLSDYEVTQSWIMCDEKKVVFSVNGGATNMGGRRVNYSECNLVFSNYGIIYTSYYNALTRKEITLSDPNGVVFREISEIDFFQNEIVVKGFEKETPNWVELHIIGSDFHSELLGEVSI